MGCGDVQELQFCNGLVCLFAGPDHDICWSFGGASGTGPVGSIAVSHAVFVWFVDVSNEKKLEFLF